MVERSASSLHLIPLLHAQFPAARFVHLYRDGPDCALSIHRHPAFRREILAIGAVRAVKLPAGSTLQQVNDALPERFRGLICPPYDARKLRSFPIPVEVFGRDRWSPMICAGVAASGRLPAASRTGLRFEDLRALAINVDPVGVIRASFGRPHRRCCSLRMRARCRRSASSTRGSRVWRFRQRRYLRTARPSAGWSGWSLFAITNWRSGRSAPRSGSPTTRTSA